MSHTENAFASRSAAVHNEVQVSTFLPDDRFLRLKSVMAKTGLSRSTIYARIKTGGFPAPVKLGPVSSAWLGSEVDGWMAARIADRGQAKETAV
jgi:prophage regulatory protein